MSIRKLSLLVAGLLLGLTACGSDGDGSFSEGESGTQAPSAEPSGPTYTAFEDFPGEELLTVEIGAPMKLRTKVVDAAWQTELGTMTADAGSHILAVYVAVTGELDDRGFVDAKFGALYLGLRSGVSGEECAATPMEQPEHGYCAANASVTGQLEMVADNQWREHDWHNGDVGGVPLEPGQTLIGVIGFRISDDTEIVDDTHLCAAEQVEEVVLGYTNCVPIPKLDPWS